MSISLHQINLSIDGGEIEDENDGSVIENGNQRNTDGMIRHLSTCALVSRFFSAYDSYLLVVVKKSTMPYI